MSTIAQVEAALREEGTDVISELESLKDYYLNAIDSEADPEEVEKLELLISYTDDLIRDYENYQAGVTTRKFHIVYSPLVSAAVAVFQKMNYHLSAELLSHAKVNEQKGSFYYPSKLNCEKIKKTKTYPKMTASNGTIEFPKEGGTADLDCYYALHAVRYLNDWSHGTLEIRDTYDFAKDNPDLSGLTGIAVDLMYKAREAEVITPYEVCIALSK